MKSIKVNTKVIAKLKPCKNRFHNWKYHYEFRTFDLVDFLGLEHITHSDKLWVALRLMPRKLVEVFAIDCVAAASAYASYDSAAAAASAYAADAAAAAAAYAVNDTAAYADAYAAATCAVDAVVYAAEAAVYAAACAADAAVYAAERQRQVEALIWLLTR